MALVYLLELGVAGWLMITRRLTATLALPLAALVLAVTALAADPATHGVVGLLSRLATDVVEPGVARLSSAIFAVILGAVLAALMQVTGAAERIVRYAAEYAGEDRFRLGVLLLLVIAVLFTTLGGLGAVILVASIALPLLFSLGFEPKAAGGLFLLGLSLGGCLNPMNWALYQSVLGLSVSEIVPYAVLVAGLFLVVSLAYLLYHTGGGGAWRRQLWPLTAFALLACITALIIFEFPAAWLVLKLIIAGKMLVLLGLLGLLLLYRTVLMLTLRNPRPGWLTEPGNWLTGATVLVPLLLLLWSSLHANLVGADQARITIGILPALLAGVLFGALASLTPGGGSANRVMRALHEAVGSAGPAVILLIGIGLLLVATGLTPVVASFQPWVGLLPVRTPLGFVALFFILSPLALYRGPLNLYGMGSGIVEIVAKTGILAAPLIMVAFFSVGMLQGVCDPTNTHNVWIANFCKVPVGELTRETFTWTLAVVLLGLLAGAMLFGASF